MSLTTELQRIIDLNNPWDEAKKKLQSTYMKVDGKLMLVHRISEDNESITANTITSNEVEEKVFKDVKSLEIWLPESGLYPLPNGQALLLVKLPRRQWLKSYNSSNYRRKIIGKGKSVIKEDDAIVLASEGSRVDFHVDFDNTIFYWEIPVGKFIDDNRFICTDSNFKQELLDWGNRCHKG